MRKNVWRYLPVLITVLLLSLVLRKVGVGELVGVARSADPRKVLLTFVVAHLVYVPSVLKWQWLLRAQGHEVPLLYLFKLYFVGTFFNNMLPSNVGGDVIRSYELGKRINDPATGLATVFVERLTGLIVLVALAILAFLIHFDQIDGRVLPLALLLACAGLAGLMWLSLDSSIPGVLRHRLPVGMLPLIAKAETVQAALHRYRNHRRVIVGALLLSLVFYVGAVLYTFVALWAFTPSVDLIGTSFVVPITMVVAMMPISFNGVGLQEWSFVLLFPRIGVPASAALSGMLLIRGVTLVTSVLGGIFHLRMKIQGAVRRPPPVAVAASTDAPR